MPALSTPRCSEIPGACVPAVGPTLIMAAASQPMEAGDAEDAIPLTQPMFDGDATDDDPPAPRLVVTDDAETGATVPSHELPVPEVGDAIVVLGRATLAQALATQDQHVPDFLQQLSDNVKGLVELVDARDTVTSVVTCAGISVAASPRPSVDRLDMGWGALETLASQPLARAREEERGCNTTSNGGSGGRLCMRRWRVRRGGACACGGLRAFAPRAQVTRTLTPCLGPLSDCLLSSAGGVPGHIGLQAAIWPGADTHRK